MDRDCLKSSRRGLDRPFDGPWRQQKRLFALLYAGLRTSVRSFLRLFSRFPMAYDMERMGAGSSEGAQAWLDVMESMARQIQKQQQNSQ